MLHKFCSELVAQISITLELNCNLIFDSELSLSRSDWFTCTLILKLFFWMTTFCTDYI